MSVKDLINNAPLVGSVALERAAHCAKCGEKHAKPINPECHPHAPLMIIYENGMLVMFCALCMQFAGKFELGPGVSEAVVYTTHGKDDLDVN